LIERRFAVLLLFKMTKRPLAFNKFDKMLWIYVQLALMKDLQRGTR